MENSIKELNEMAAGALRFMGDLESQVAEAKKTMTPEQIKQVEDAWDSKGFERERAKLNKAMGKLQDLITGT